MITPQSTKSIILWWVYFSVHPYIICGEASEHLFGLECSFLNLPNGCCVWTNLLWNASKSGTDNHVSIVKALYSKSKIKLLSDMAC